MLAWNYERVQIGDLYYNLDTASQTAEVTHQNSNYPYVLRDDKVYTVTGQTVK